MFFPKVDNAISWEGHLGDLCRLHTFVYKTKEYTKVIKYDWEHPDFNPYKTVLCSVLTKTVISLIYQLRKSLFFLF
jgi:hypothetical protein